MGRQPKEFVPLRVRKYVRARQHAWECSRQLRRGLRRLQRDPRGCREVWNELVDGWDNKRWSAGVEYLDAVARASLDEDGPILECGSGLTTLVLATIARRNGAQLWTLEHDARCYELVQARLRRFGLEANVLRSPLRDYGSFDWYDVQPSALPSFSLVVCDGPPKRTRGGRLGLLPVLDDRLGPRCLILLDDASRAEEREVLSRWAEERPLWYELRGVSRPYAAVELQAPS
jgi:predicted O-methyltransferase YrrM